MKQLERETGNNGFISSMVLGLLCSPKLKFILSIIFITV